MSITPKAIQDLLDELEASKQSRLCAWSVLQRLRMVLSEMGSVAIPPLAKKTFDAEGEALEHALRKSFPSPQRCNQKSLFLGAALSRCHHQGGMQRRLSARSSGVVESFRSGGGSDSELSHVGAVLRTTGRRISLLRLTLEQFQIAIRTGHDPVRNDNLAVMP